MRDDTVDDSNIMITVFVTTTVGEGECLLSAIRSRLKIFMNSQQFTPFQPPGFLAQEGKVSYNHAKIMSLNCVFESNKYPYSDLRVIVWIGYQPFGFREQDYGMNFKPMAIQNLPLELQDDSSAVEGNR